MVGKLITSWQPATGGNFYGLKTFENIANCRHFSVIHSLETHTHTFSKSHYRAAFQSISQLMVLQSQLLQLLLQLLQLSQLCAALPAPAHSSGIGQVQVNPLQLPTFHPLSCNCSFQPRRCCCISNHFTHSCVISPTEVLLHFKSFHPLLCDFTHGGVASFKIISPTLV